MEALTGKELSRKPVADLIARAKFSSQLLRNAHGHKNLLSFFAIQIREAQSAIYLCRRMAAEWRFL